MDYQPPGSHGELIVRTIQTDSSNYRPDSSNYQLQADNQADSQAVSFVVYISEEVPYQITLIRCSRGGLEFGQEGGESHLGDAHGE